MSSTVKNYVDLLDAFLCGKLAIRNFEERFLHTWQNCTDPLIEAEVEAGDSASRALEDLFYAVDSYRAEPEECDPRLELDEASLRERAKVAIRALQG